MGLPYKYITSFNDEVRASSESIEDLSSGLSEASLSSLKPLIPQDIDFDRNIDLLGIAFNAAVVNRFNKNDDGITTETALAALDYFINKPTNIEHNKQKVVGHVVSAGFSKYGEASLIRRDEIDPEDLTPFNIALASVVYKAVNSEFASLVERSVNPEDELYQSVSASWEIGFSDYVIALGSKNLEEAEIIEDEKHIEELKANLRAFDGSGKLEDGTEIYRLVTGDVYPLGIGFTANPAADVKGIFLHGEDKKKGIEANEDRMDVEIIHVESPAFSEKINISKKNNSHAEKTHVNLDEIKNVMEVNELLDQIKALIEEKSEEKFSEESVANIIKVVSDAIRDKSEQYVSEKAEAEQAKQEAVDAQVELEKKIELIEKDLSSSTERVQELESEQAEAKAEQLFNGRMEELDKEYELSDEDRKVIVADVRSLDLTEESFSAFQEKMKVIFSHKAKEFIQEQKEIFEKAVQAEVAKEVSTTLKTEEKTEAKDDEGETEVALDQVEATSEEVSSNNAETAEKEDSFRDKFEKAFSEDNVIINY